ncbi:hypothetical protein GWK47_012861 [Chionoecetes opilio]|uniref:Uncharacterized protein n=1 Tax=Chionoecetes opilio TaxID=41210 RepID=A0A8J4XWZ0_CHIOP|nr:hypothetical protein GWK47_012861 [Chionoecetes opilio]
MRQTQWRRDRTRRATGDALAVRSYSRHTFLDKGNKAYAEDCTDPATDVTGRTRCAASTWHWTTVSPGVVDGRSAWPLTKPRQCSSPGGKTSPTCLRLIYSLRVDHSRFTDPSPSLGCVRHISHLLHAKGVEVLYKAQVRLLMEYSPLAWSSCPPSYLATLDRFQRRAQRLVNGKRPHLAPESFQPLQDVAGLCVMHKALNLRTLQLAAIKFLRPPPPLHSTRVAPYRQEQVTVPFSRTEHHLRSFLPRYGCLWNQLVRQTDLHHHASLQDFKRRVKSWLMA